MKDFFGKADTAKVSIKENVKQVNVNKEELKVTKKVDTTFFQESEKFPEPRVPCKVVVNNYSPF